MHLGLLLLSLCVTTLVHMSNTRSGKVYAEDDTTTSQPEATTDTSSSEKMLTDITLLLNETYNVLRIGDSNDTTTETFDPTKHPNWKMFNQNTCGMTVSFRFWDEEDGFAEYPWVALLGFQVNESKELHYACGGVLVSERYVLTAAHCTKIGDPEYTLKTIRLGEFDLTTNPDCVPSECASPIQEIIPEEVVIHAGYNKANHMGHDIALIRLRKNAVLSRYVHTICMVYNSTLRSNFTGESATFAGWGIYEFEGNKRSDKLQVLKEKIASNELCTAKLGHQLNVTDSDLCVKVQNENSTCAGDSGGPVMYDNFQGFSVIGILSLGPENCDEGTPALATGVSSHIKWILDNVRN